MNFLYKAVVLSALSLSTSVNAGIIISDFSSLHSDATLYRDASLQSGEVQLTRSAGSQLGGLSFSDQDSGAAIDSWSAMFDFRIDQNFHGGADGISLSFSRLGTVGAVGEEGLFSGLAIGFDTWSNGEGSDNHVSLRYDGVLLAQQHISDFLLQDGTLREAVISLDNGLIDVSINGTSYLNHNVAGWEAYAGQFNFGGRTGWAGSRQIIDNFTGTTNAVPEPSIIALLSLGLIGMAFTRRKMTK